MESPSKAILNTGPLLVISHLHEQILTVVEETDCPVLLSCFPECREPGMQQQCSVAAALVPHHFSKKDLEVKEVTWKISYVKRNSSAGSCPWTPHHAVLQGIWGCNLWIHSTPCSSELYAAGVCALYSARICFLCFARKAWDPEGWQRPSSPFLMMPFHAEKLNFLAGDWS